ncbi:MAG: AEC family transporter [Saccharospirillum sp.]
MIANALGPVFLLILIGVMLRRLDFPGAAFWPGIERLTYYLAFPALLVHRLALADFSEANFLAFGGVIGGSLVLVTLVIWLLKHRVSTTSADFTSVFQGGIRFNTYIGLAAASALFGDAGLVIAAIAAGIMIPLVNVLCIVTFALANDEQSLSLTGLLRGLISNPLILGCLGGIGLNLSGVGLPGWSAEVLARLGATALPLGLLAVGVALSLGTVKQDGRAIVYSSLFKFLVLPGTMLGLSALLGLDTLSRQVLLLLACLPTASSAYILARQLGGNAPMMANIISTQSLLAFAIMPVWLALGMPMLH